MSDDVYWGETNTHSSSLVDPLPQNIGPWRLLHPIGRGASGAVFAAQHTTNEQRVALKWLHVGGPSHRVRKERFALRLLDSPHIARWVDDGVFQGRPYLVMNWVEGTPFPGRHHARPVSWTTLKPLVGALLVALQRLHLAGFFHLDLKPDNVLVTPDNTPILVDFGLTQGPTLGDRPPAEDIAAGTIGYLAPEQAAGHHVDARSDLYAVGVMVVEALLGHKPPQDHQRLQTLLEYRHTPPAVTAALCRLLAPLPHHRPASANAALDALNIHLAQSVTLPVRFVGPTPFLHSPEDGEAAFSRATQHTPPKQVLEQWLRAGWIEVRSTDTVRLTPAGLRHVGSPGLALTVTQHLARASQAQEDGQLNTAATHLSIALTQARWLRWEEPSRSLEPECRILQSWLVVAVSLEQAAMVERISTLADRYPPSRLTFQPLISAAAALFQGQPAQATAILQRTPIPTASMLGCLWWRLRLQAATTSPPTTQEELLTAAWHWADQHNQPNMLSQVDSWRGQLRYRQGLFEDAARLHERAQGHAQTPARRVSATLSAASAWLEVGDTHRCEALATAARHRAARIRHRTFEIRSVWLQRSAAYRRGDDLQPDPALVDAALCCDLPLWAGLLVLTEAAIAWRGGTPERATIARTAELLLRQAHHPAAALVASTLVAAATADVRQADHIAQQAQAPLIDDISWQILGLLSLAGLLSPRDQRLALRLARQQPHPNRRRDVLAPTDLIKNPSHNNA